MRHADLLREATAVIATPASAPCIILQCGTWYGCVAVWPCGCVCVCLFFLSSGGWGKIKRVGVCGGGMKDAIGSKNT